jgi:hypothetical protein
MDHLVQFAVHAHLEAGGDEVLPGGDHVQPVGVDVGQQGGGRGVGPDLQVGVPRELVNVEVVGVLVGDQDGLRAVQRLLLAERAGVDHERPVALLQPDEGVGVLEDPHAGSLGTYRTSGRWSRRRTGRSPSGAAGDGGSLAPAFRR